MKPETQAIHAGYQIDPATGALAQPIHLSTTFERDEDGEFARGYKYIRDGNPNRLELEERLTTLEGGHACAMFSSGSTAMLSLLQALKTGDHVIAPADMYFGIQVILKEIMQPWGLETTFVDMSQPDAVAAAITDKTRMIIAETPSNPMMTLTDIAAIADIAQAHNLIFVVDNTIGTSIFQSPFELGADIVVHSTTKFISGHSDVLGGALITREQTDFFEHVYRIQRIGGATADPYSCWLTLRGIMTMPVRVRAMNENSYVVAEYLENHPQIERVLHPALASHPQHDLFKKQMRGATGLFSFQVIGDAQNAINFTNHLKIIKRVTSFGGVRSKIEHRASIEEGTSTPQNLLRISIGLEHPDDLIEDIEQALASVK
ncbi:MAG: aminotransferase class I/II-fold pyridoxal phosphate-dependent enzyme [Phototrophicaceae bacterium]